MRHILLLTGISGSGKTTLGRALVKLLSRYSARPIEFIDGDMARDFLETRRYSPKERFLVTKQIAYAAHLLAKNGIDVIVANIAGSRRTRYYLKRKWKRYIQVFLDADIHDCIKNDSKNVYKKALNSKHPRCYGIDIRYDRPRNPDVIIYPYKESVEEGVEKILLFLRKHGFILPKHRQK